ncbi:MAG: GTP-binding protein TypA/BipA [Planctomycetes bacterium]|nr:GTP-binding protein TypA/BipA [Planctomycetota bacterium]
MPDIRNIAIVAHVDHGKTTLVDGLLRQSGLFRDNQVVAERVMDSNDQERERGITILAKNTAVEWKGVRINIVDTPGHADFGSEVERVLNMVDAVLLLVDAAEGPMPQTRFVLSKALSLGKKALVCINKIDRKDARTAVVLDEVFDLFVALDATDAQLDFPVVYACAREGWAVRELEEAPGTNLSPLFDMILEHAPPPSQDASGPLQFQVATLDYSAFLGRICIGRIRRGRIARGMNAIVCKLDGTQEPVKVTKLQTFRGLERIDCDAAEAGDIVALSGAGSATVGDTICPAETPDPLPAIAVDEPTLSMTFTANTSPFAGREGKYVTSRQIKDRLDREAIANVGLRIEPGPGRESFVVSGRGTLHLSVLIESMRREGYELGISQPQVIEKDIDGVPHEPFETVVVLCPDASTGAVIQKLAQRGGEMVSLKVDEQAQARMEWTIPSRGLIGYRSEFLTDTRGAGNLYHQFEKFGPQQAKRRRRLNGVLIVLEDGESVAYSLNSLQERGQLFVGPGEKVYRGMICGLNSRDNDLVVNPCKGKKLTNIRAAGSDDNVILTPPRKFSLEEALEFIEQDELVEVTPQTIRLRKRNLDHEERKREDRAVKSAE